LILNSHNARNIMADRKNITFFELKDETGRTGKKKRKKTQVETVFFKTETEDNQTHDAERTSLQLKLKSEEEVDYISEPDRKFLELLRRGVFACPRYDKLFETEDAKIE